MKLRLPGHRFRRFALITGFVLVAASGWIFRPGAIRALRGDHSPEDALIEGVLGIIRQHYADSLDERDLRLRAVEGILRSLPDRYSTLLVGDQPTSYQAPPEGAAGGGGSPARRPRAGDRGRTDRRLVRVPRGAGVAGRAGVERSDQAAPPGRSGGGGRRAPADPAA